VNTLIIGREPGNIADETARILELRSPASLIIDSPHQSELDVRNRNEIHSALYTHGPYDQVLYSVGVNRLRWIKDITLSEMIDVYNINVFGFVSVVTEHVRMYPDHPTRFVAVVSDASHTPMRGSLLYCSSKTALTGVIRNMARELAPKQTVVGVSPTVVEDTPMTDYIDSAVPEFRGWAPEVAREYERANIPMNRRVTKGEVAETIVFALTGPDMLTGSIIDITGGK
jgi:NAD(P)-dependent dehydrogenase (short-subunit alcohol dehydrogenase family)